MATPAVTALSASPTVVTATVTKGDPTHVRARLTDIDGTQEDEQQRSGAGDISLTMTTGKWPKFVVAWGCNAGGTPSGEPSAPKRVDTFTGAMVVSFSTNGGSTWDSASLRGDAWPGTTGRHVLHFTLRQRMRSKSLRVKLTGSDQKRDGVRKIIAFGAPISQKSPTP